MNLMKTLFNARSKTVLSVSLLFCVGRLFAQPDISQLLTKLHSARTDTAITYAYRDIFRYYQYSDPDSAVYYLRQGLGEVTQRDYKLGIANLTVLMANADMDQGHMDQARKHSLEALQVFTEAANKDGIAFANNNLGTIEGRSGNYDKAIAYFMKALKINESTGNERGVLSGYLKLGVVNERTNDLDKALDYYNKAMDIARKEPDSVNVVTLYNNIGIVYGKRGAFKKAIECFDNAIQLSAKHPRLGGMEIQSLMNMGIVYDNLEQNTKAIGYLDRAMALARERHFPEDYARIIENIASVYEKTNPAKAFSILGEALDTARAIGNKSLQLDILDAMIASAKTGKDYKAALAIYEQERALRDSLFNIGKAKEIANLQSTYELDKSNEKVQQLMLSEKRNAQKRDIIIMVAAGLALTLLAMFFFYRKTRSLNVQLLKREAELKKANTIKDKLFSIIGHDLRGPIANAPHMISIYNMPATTAEEKQYLVDALAENASASLDTLDKLLYWGQSQIKGIGMTRSVFDAAPNVDNILHLMKGSAERKQISIVNKIPADTTVYADPTHFDFITRNLLSNAIKFTNTGGTITLNVNKTVREGYVVFSVTDNGVGMDKLQLARVFEPMASSTLGTANERGTSIGLMLCKEFVEENGGSISAESKLGEGTTFYFALLAEAKNA